MNRREGIFKMLIIQTLISATFLGCSIDNKDVSGNKKFYVPEGYELVLKEKGLTEIATMPYFKSPFITISKNDNGDQFAVIFRESGQIESVKLPMKMEEIVKTLESKGFKLSDFRNLHIFEINKRLVWNGEGKLYLDLEGREVDPFVN